MDGKEAFVTAGEVIGLSLTVAMLAFLSGVLMVAARDQGKSAEQGDRDSRRAKLAGYLSARRAVTRASLTFVASFRALARSKEASPHTRLRVKEAHASRRRLHQALDDLDKAQAELIVWFPEWRRAGEGGRRVDVATLRAAVEGTDADVETLAKRLSEADRSAAASVRDGAKTLQGTSKSFVVNDLAQALIEVLSRFRR